jgi:hypothetical protein
MLLLAPGCGSSFREGTGDGGVSGAGGGDAGSGTGGSEANGGVTGAGGGTSDGGASAGGKSGGGASGGVSSGGRANGGAGGAGSGGGKSGGGTGGAGTGGGKSGGMGGTGMGGTGMGGAADLCDKPSDCPGGTCWQRRDGVKDCVEPTPAPTLASCEFTSTPCCTKDGDCTDKASGRCLPLRTVQENFCGGAVPQGNVCRYDLCASDADCKAQTPTGATVATCLPSGALGNFFAKCAYGGCRTDADCTKNPGGRCAYGLAASNGVCSLVNVLFCAYPSDPCGEASAPACSAGMVCVPNDDYQGRKCGKAPPMYP